MPPTSLDPKEPALNTNGHSPNSFRLDHKRVVVTGGARGIGKSIAALFAGHGATVHIMDINPDEATATVKQIQEAGGEVSYVRCDVTDSGAVKSTFEKITATGRLNVLVNSAGIAHIGNLESTSEDDFDVVYRVNVKGIFNCMQAVIGHMKERGGGTILNMASIAASAGLSDRFAYSTSKGAVLAMTYSVAKDYLEDNIRCNCISPARVHTPFVDGFVKKNYPGREEEVFERLSKSQPVGRMAKPEEVASLALYLCSEAASFVTGVDYPLDGGFFTLRG